MDKKNEKQLQIPLPSEGESQIDLFKKKSVRKVFHENEWWFSVKDVLEALVDVSDGTKYAADLRRKDSGLNERYSEITRTLNYASPGGIQQTKFVNIEGIFRIMQSVSSNKAEDFKKWLAKVGFERVQEIQNPELALKRAIVYYKAKGYDDAWVEARIQNKISREQLETEWEKRGIKEPVHYAVLTDAIAVETFGVKIQKHKDIKGLKKSHNLRDNMTPIELTLTTLGKQATKEIAKTRDAKGFDQNLQAAKSGGHIAGTARIQIEQETKRSVVSKENYLTDRQKKDIQPQKEVGSIIKKLFLGKEDE
ncbi:MAG: Bro-N domain-containing protein [Candidatus Parcubacteria bacterium]|nr:Bro-N domain-containing protein [Candidatus Parcubacteria bacterium]